MKDESVGKQGKDMDEQALKMNREELREAVEKSNLDQTHRNWACTEDKKKVGQFQLNFPGIMSVKMSSKVKKNLKVKVIQ